MSGRLPPGLLFNHSNNIPDSVSVSKVGKTRMTIIIIEK